MILCVCCYVSVDKLKYARQNIQVNKVHNVQNAWCARSHSFYLLSVDLSILATHLMAVSPLFCSPASFLESLRKGFSGSKLQCSCQRCACCLAYSLSAGVSSNWSRYMATSSKHSAIDCWSSSPSTMSSLCAVIPVFSIN